MILKRIREKLYPYKKMLISIFRYPKLQFHDKNYDEYWELRHLSSDTPLNNFQQRRLELALKYIKEGSIVTDIGAGNGLILVKLNEFKKFSKMIAVDVSPRALETARQNGIETFRCNISDVEELKKLPETDYMIFFEVLEHIPNSEEVFKLALSKARRGILFSVPNTGFLTYRLRLLLGKFPLQWRLNPSEHLRFWTMADIKWWLNSLEVKKYHLHMYEGIPILENICPSLFSQGIFVFIPVSNVSD